MGVVTLTQTTTSVASALLFTFKNGNLIWCQKYMICLYSKVHNISLEDVGKVFARVVSENRLFKLMCSQVQKSVQVVIYIESANAQVVQEEDNLMIWHERLGHLREQNQNLFIWKNLIIGMDPKFDCQLTFCVGCVNKNQCRNPFWKGNPKQMWQSPLELVHTNLCRPMKTISITRGKTCICN